MKNIYFIIYFFLFNLLFNSPLSSQSTIDKLNQELIEVFENSKIPGMSVSIVNQKKVLFKNAFGYADLKTKKPYTEHTIHNIGSTSKTFIGISIMQLVEQGRLDLDTDINTILPFTVINPYHPETVITIRQLATHTSSIRDRTFNYELKSYVSNDREKGNRKGLPWRNKFHFKRMLKNEDISLRAFLENTLSKKGKWYKKKNYYKTAPGTTENYSNIGAALGGLIVEIISGEKYADYVMNHITKPLGLTHTTWTKDSSDTALFAERYINGVAVPDYHLITYPDGGLISSASDINTYLIEMIKGYKGKSQLLTAESFTTMMSNQMMKSPLKKSMTEQVDRSGIFWDIFGSEGTGDIGHNGSDPGIVTFMYFDPESGNGCLLKSNIDADDKHFKDVIKMWKILIKYRGKISD